VPIIDSSFNLLSLLPLSHMFELMGGFLVPLYHGAAVVYLRTLKPSAIMEALKEEDIHLLMSVPRLMQLLQTAVERELEKNSVPVCSACCGSWQKSSLRICVKCCFFRYSLSLAAISKPLSLAALPWILKFSGSGPLWGSWCWRDTG